jgi:hypothetical protein
VFLKSASAGYQFQTYCLDFSNQCSLWTSIVGLLCGPFSFRGRTSDGQGSFVQEGAIKNLPPASSGKNSRNPLLALTAESFIRHLNTSRECSPL